MKASTDKMNEIVRVNIIIFMNQKNMSIMDIVKKHGKLHSNIYKYINGERKISLKTFEFFSEVLDIKFVELFNEEIYNKFKDIYKEPIKKRKNVERDKLIHFYIRLSPNKKTLQQLANEFNISRQRVEQIEKKYETKKI